MAYSVEKLQKLVMPDFRRIQFSSMKLLKTYPESDEMVCAESLGFLYIPLVSKWTKLLTEAENFSRPPKQEFSTE
jgi:hypothetical protein